MDAAMVFLLPVALAVGLWLMARATDKRAAGQDAAVRRTYTRDVASSPWIRREASELADEPSDATDEPAEILELEASGGLPVPKKPYYQQSKD
jgi:hypothetical protein